MPEKKPTQNSKGSAWWILLVVGIITLFIPGGVFIMPMFLIMAIIMRRKNKPKEKSETPHSLLPLINTQP